MGKLQKIDYRLLNSINKIFSCNFCDYIMPKITALDNFGIIWIVVASLLLISKDYKEQGFIFVVALALGVLIGNVILKPLISRDRPCWKNDTKKLLIDIPEDYSFPSCHTLSSVIAAVILCMTNLHFGFIAIPIATLISFSRIYLYVHYPSDVLGGVVIGIVIGLVVWKFQTYIPFVS